MPEPDEVLAVVGEWVEKAEHDLTAAACTLRVKRNCPTDVACFHATRYPGDYDPIMPVEARDALALARRVRVAARKVLFPRNRRRRTR
jgi:hypothetical protein